MLTKNKNFRVSNKFPNPFKDINLSNEELITIPNYLNYIENYLKTTFTLGTDQDYVFKYLENMEQHIKSSVLKEKLAYEYGMLNLIYSSRPDDTYNLLERYILDSEYKNKISDLYNTIKKAAAGSKFRNTTFLDSNGKTMTFNDLRGKLVYIDFWATWCLPCIEEIPYLKKLQTKYANANIHFVSICIDDTKLKWNSFIEERKLSGIQLFANESNTKLLKDNYSINGLPRFILLDEKGRILNNNAKSPSNPNLEFELNSAL